MSAFGELRRDGQFGPAGLALLGALMEQEARRLPVLGRTHWPLTRVEDLTQSFFVERGMALTTNLVAAGVTDDVALGKYVRRSVRNWLTDQARKTDRGALRRQLERILGQEPSFEKVPAGSAGANSWRLVGAPGPPWQGDLTDLVKAARSVPLRPMHGGDERRPSLGSGDEVVALLTAVFTKAGGPLEVAQLADVALRRLPSLMSPVEASLDETAGHEGAAFADQSWDPETVVLAAEQELDDALYAAWLYRELSAWERQILPVIENLADISATLGCGRSTANTRRQQLLERLRELCGGEPPTGGVFVELIRLCQQ